MDARMSKAQATIASFKPRTKAIFLQLLERNEFTPTQALAAPYRLNVRTIRYDLQEIAYACRHLPLNLVRDRRRGVIMEGSAADRQQVMCWIQEAVGIDDARGMQGRLYKLLAVLLTKDEPVAVKQLEDVLHASPRTIYADMSKAEDWFNGVGLQLIRKPHYGSKVEGPELLLRYGACMLVQNALGSADNIHEPPKKELDGLQHALDGVDRFVVETLMEPSHLPLLESMVTSCASNLSKSHQLSLFVYLAIACKRMRQGHFIFLTKTGLKQIQESQEYPLAIRLMRQLEETSGLVTSEQETACVALHYIGAWARIPFDPSVVETANTDSYVERIVEGMLIAVDHALGIVLSTDEELFRGLLLHVKPMVYRIMNGIPLQNELLEEIKTDHALAYYAAVTAGHSIETTVGKSVSSAEIGYIALHFGAALERRHRESSRDSAVVRVAVVCSGGIGTAKILESLLETKQTNLRVVQQLSKNQVRAIDLTSALDGIVSTVPLTDTPVPHIVVNPLLPAVDLERLNTWVKRLLGSRRQETIVANLRNAVERVFHQQRVKILQPDILTFEIQHLLNRLESHMEFMESPNQAVRSHRQTVDSERKRGPKTLDLLTREVIKVNDSAQTREDVIEQAGLLLVQSGAVEPQYVEAMKESIVQNGPYMVIVPGVAILHARPEDGVRRVCMSLVTLSEGVPFGHKDNDPVRIAIAFGAVDHHQHLDALSGLMQLLSDNQAVADIQAAESVDRVVQILNRVLA